MSNNPKGKRLPELPWERVAERVRKSVFRLYTDTGAGTCFVIGLGSSPDRSSHHAMLATAWHVVEEFAHKDGNIRIVSRDKGIDLSTPETPMNLIGFDPKVFDTALIQVQTKEPLLRETELCPIPDEDWIAAQGKEVGWMGYPGLVEPEPCFFHGYVSGHLQNPSVYLVDGVAIHGVSGGPAFDKKGQFVGLVSSYLPNRVDANTTLPGLLTLVPINVIRYFMVNTLKAQVR